ncbi:MAG: TonB-dependent receptor [Ilyomonas sp.]
MHTKLLSRKHIFFLFLNFLFVINTQAQNIHFKGTVYDFDNHQPLVGVNVSTEDKKFNTITDSAGYFSFSLPVNSYTLVFTMIGYQKLAEPIYVLDKTTGEFFLKRNALNELQEVTVETRKRDAAIKDLQMSTVRINPAQLKRTPLVLGEADILRSLTLQPGIVTNGETVSGYSVRGGNADQNLVLIDGAPLFNISHLLGFYTGVSADAIQDFTFYKAGIPAQYGSRLSSIMLLNVKPGNPDTMHFNTGIGPVSTHLFMNGPIIKNKLTVMAGGRIAYPKLMMNLFPGDVKNSDAFYYDDVIKLSYTPDQNNRISATFYNSYDKYKFPGDTSFQWKNYIGSLQWKSNLTTKLNLLLSGNISKYRSFINGLNKYYAFKLGSGIEQKEGKAVFNYNFNTDNSITLGGDYVHYTINPGELKPANDSSNIVSRKIADENARELSGFFTTENKITNFLSTQLGFRVTQYQYLGPKDIFLYERGAPKTPESITDTAFYSKNENIKSYQGFEPRLLMRILLNNSSSVKLSYNRIYQYLHLVSNTTAITPVDYYKLSDTYIQPAYTDQYAIGFFKNFQENNFETSLEGYYKNTEHTIDYKNGANLSLNPALETALLPAKAYAYGVELSVRKNRGTVTGFASYTYSRSFTKVLTPFAQEMVNSGNYYASNSDKPHNLVLAATVKLGKGWLFSSNFVYTSGRTATYPDGSYIINGNIVTNYSLRNEDRLPSYNRLDIAFSYDSRRYPEQRRYSVLNFSFYNVYMHKNVYSVYFKRVNEQIKSYQLSVIGTIIPSISWNYNF